jgi:uncharacterized protein
MLRADLRELARGPVETRADLPTTDGLFAGLDFALAEPVRVTGRLQPAGEGRFYWHAKLAARVTETCRRCLEPVQVTVEADVKALFTQDPDALDDPDSYPLPPDAMEVDVASAVREELILAVPQYVVCRDDCRGLCARCGHDLNAGPCGCAPATDLRWQALAALKGKLPD